MDGKDRSHPGTGVTLPTQPHIHIWISGHLPARHSPFHTHLRHLSSADTTPWEPLRRCGSWALGCPITLHPTACPPPLPASGLLTPRPWQCGAGWAICTHILKFSPSQLLLRQEVMVCRACSDPVHTQRSLGQSSTPPHRSSSSSREGSHFQKHFWEDFFLSVSFPRVE